MKKLTWLAVLVALGCWSFVASNSASAHPGTECSVFDCGEDHEGDEESGRAILGEEEEEDDDAERSTFDCGEDHGDEETERSAFDCEDEEESGRAVLDCGEDHEESDES